MAARKKKTECEKFKNVYEDLVLPEFKNFDIELDVEFYKTYWIETGEVDYRKNVFNLVFDVKDKSFSKLMKKDISGVLGWRSLFYSQEHEKFLIKKEYGTTEEQKELLRSLIDKFKELDEKIDYIREDSPQTFHEDAIKFQRKFENPNFLLEYDVENSRCYFISKGFGLSDYNLFNRANVAPSAWDIKEIEDDTEHKVKNIPGYKNKPYLKEYVRKKCFWIPASNYSMIATSVRNYAKIEEERMAKSNSWLDKPENQERVKKVLISELNDFGISIKYDDKKKVMIFTCKKFEASVFNGSVSRRGSSQTITHTRDDALSMLLYNEVLLRPEKPSDKNRNDGLQEAALRLDDNDMWFTPDENKPSSILGDHHYGFLSKVLLGKRPDSKNGIYYLEIEANIEELETIKENFERFKKEYIEKFQEYSIPNVSTMVMGYNYKYPGMYLDKDTGKAYLLFDGERTMSDDGLSHNFVSKKAIEIDEKKVEEILSNEAKHSVYSEIKSNFEKLYLTQKIGNVILDEIGRACLEELKLSWRTANVMNKFGVSFTSYDENSPPEEGYSGNSFKL